MSRPFDTNDLSTSRPNELLYSLSGVCASRLKWAGLDPERNDNSIFRFETSRLPPGFALVGHDLSGPHRWTSSEHRKECFGLHDIS